MRDGQIPSAASDLLDADPCAAGSSPVSGLQQGTLSWVNVAFLGVSIAISGNFSGWNYGLGEGGFGGMLLAAAAMCLLFLCLTQCLAELATALPAESGFDGYARLALGPMAAYASGMSVAIALAVGSGLALSFMEAYASETLGIGGWPIKLLFMAAVLALQLRGARDAVVFSMLVGALALTVLIIFCAFLVPAVQPTHWFALSVADKRGLLPNGLVGAVRCVPYALFLFLGVEQAAHATSEMKDVAHSLPKALTTAVAVAAVIGLSVFLIATGSGAEQLPQSADPLIAVLSAHSDRYGSRYLLPVVGIGAISSLVATFFSLIYAGSRQFYHLAAAGDLPRWLSRVTHQQAPGSALALVAVIGLAAAAFPPNAVMVVFIFLISVSHLLLLLAFIRLRRSRAELSRPYRAPGGQPIAWLGLVLSATVALSCYRLQLTALNCAVLGLVLLLIQFRLQRTRLFCRVK